MGRFAKSSTDSYFPEGHAKNSVSWCWRAGRGGGGSYKRLVLAPGREKALKGFPSPPDVTETKANLSGFRNLVVQNDQLYSGMLQHPKKSNHSSLKGCRLQSEHTGRNLACLYLLPTLCLLISHLQVPLEDPLLSTAKEPPAPLNNLLDKISCSNIGSWCGKHNKGWLKEHCVITSSTLCACAWG